MATSNIFQLKIALIVFVLGVIAGAIYGITHLNIGIFQNKIYKMVADFICTIISAIILILGVNTLTYGEYRLYILVFFMLGIIFERVSIGKLFAKLISFVYNYICSMVIIAKNTRVYKFIFR